MLLRQLVTHLPPLHIFWDGGWSVVRQRCFKGSYNTTTECLHGVAAYSPANPDTILLL
jgi:hypothetical protein